ncbi:MAG: hypothetical protein H0T90_00555 [Gemmatimonadales bacterium]|nr:hypothetical protein [Gemmatimonadales bacterium]
MRLNSPARFAAVGILVSALACAGNSARTDEEDETATAQDTSAVQNPPGYRGMERDTAMVPAAEGTDTFLQQQGTGTGSDTAGYSGMERQREDSSGYGQTGQADTSGMGQTDTSGFGQTDTSGMTGQMDTTGMADDTSTGQGATGLDSTGMSETGDTTGYEGANQQMDSTSN